MFGSFNNLPQASGGCLRRVIRCIRVMLDWLLRTMLPLIILRNLATTYGWISFPEDYVLHIREYLIYVYVPAHAIDHFMNRRAKGSAVMPFRVWDIPRRDVPRSDSFLKKNGERACYCQNNCVELEYCGQSNPIGTPDEAPNSLLRRVLKFVFLDRALRALRSRKSKFLKVYDLVSFLVVFRL